MRRSGLLWVVATLLCLAFLSGCGSDDDGGGDSLDSRVRRVATDLGLTGDPRSGETIPDIDSPLAQLGLKLFFTKALGGDQDSACVTCHHPALGGGDDLSLPVGVGAVEPDLLGPGREHAAGAHGHDGGPTVPRNAPTTFNIALWKKALFWDGRVEAEELGIRTPDVPFGSADVEAGADLPQAQARFPVTSGEEMKGFVFEAGSPNNAIRSHLAARLGDFGAGAGELRQNGWLAEFQYAFGSTQPAETLITFDRIVQAISAYERSQLFVDTPWKAYLEGDDQAISASAKRGALLFCRSRDEGGAGCAECHSGDFFTDEQHHVVAMPQIGRGKGDGASGHDDFGRNRETGEPEDLYAFRTPTLLNVAATGPWTHAGAYASLEAAVRHHLDPVSAFDSYDYTQLDPSIPASGQTDHTEDLTRAAQSHLDPALQPIQLTDEQVTDLVNFLHALTDPCAEDRQCLDPWIEPLDVPGLSRDPDGLRVEAYDQNGDPL